MRTCTFSLRTTALQGSCVTCTVSAEPRPPRRAFPPPGGRRDNLPAWARGGTHIKHTEKQGENCDDSRGVALTSVVCIIRRPPRRRRRSHSAEGPRAVVRQRTGALEGGRPCARTWHPQPTARPLASSRWGGEPTEAQGEGMLERRRGVTFRSPCEADSIPAGSLTRRAEGRCPASPPLQLRPLGEKTLPVHRPSRTVSLTTKGEINVLKKMLI